LGRLSL